MQPRHFDLGGTRELHFVLERWSLFALSQRAFRTLVHNGISGLAFGALVAAYRPDLLEFASLNKQNPMDTLRRAFQAAEQVCLQSASLYILGGSLQAGIPSVFSPKDVLE